MPYSKQLGFGGTHSLIFNFKTPLEKRGDKKGEEEFFGPCDFFCSDRRNTA